MKWEIGYQHPFEIRKERYMADVPQRFSVLYLSDFHFNVYGQYLVKTIAEAVRTLKPDIILLGGDYADTKKGLWHLENLMSKLATNNHVFAIAGNHDYFFGLRSIQNIITRYGGIWIEKESHVFTCKGATIQIAGNLPAKPQQVSDLSILCLHKPVDITPFAAHYQLAFAGHLHGCQVVGWRIEKGLYPGRFFYKWNLLQTKISKCVYLISKGLGDTLPIRYNCKKDMLFVDVVPNPDF